MADDECLKYTVINKFYFGTVECGTEPTKKEKYCNRNFTNLMDYYYSVSVSKLIMANCGFLY